MSQFWEFQEEEEAEVAGLNSCISQPTVLHVHEETEMVQEVSPNDGLFYLSEEEDPLKHATEADVEREGTLTKGRDGSTVDGS